VLKLRLSVLQSMSTKAEYHNLLICGSSMSKVAKSFIVVVVVAVHEIVSVQLASEPGCWQSCLLMDDTERQKYSRHNCQKHDNSRGAWEDPVFAVR